MYFDAPICTQNTLSILYSTTYKKEVHIIKSWRVCFQTSTLVNPTFHLISNKKRTLCIITSAWACIVVVDKGLHFKGLSYPLFISLLFNNGESVRKFSFSDESWGMPWNEQGKTQHVQLLIAHMTEEWRWWLQKYAVLLCPGIFSI